MGKNKVLIVDDEEDFLKIVKLNLEETGNYEVKTLPSAKDIISVVHSFKPDVILLDMLMPMIGGVEACEMLNEDPAGQDVPIIVVSALSKSQDKRKAYKEGVVIYVDKPIEKKELILAIERALQFKR
ncbi:MAG: response regulator [Candidatus Omnitrophota bacterium]